MADGKLLFETDIDQSGFKSGVSKMEKTGSKLGAGFKATGAAIAKGAVAASVGIVAIGKASLDAYADYEQLVGGVDTLFKENSKTVQKYASEAYKTAGMSANQYMETVTSFSASLIQSLGGDTKKAAEYGNQAVIDMSDNANKMGTSMEDIQNAYQGFAKQNYTMLDNLKLGYGGTKSEMERLLADAEKLTGQKYDISNFSDVTAAIHAIQTEMGITGTTAKEAASTIQGSVTSMKASWENLLAGMADENADMDKLLDEFIESVQTVAKNILPHLKTIAGGIVDMITALIPEIPKLLEQLLPVLITALVGLIKELAAALPQITTVIVGLIPEIVDAFLQVLPVLITALVGLIKELADALPQITAVIVGLIPEIIDAFLQVLPALIQATGQIITAIVQQLPVLIPQIVESIIENLPLIVSAVLQVAIAVLVALVQYAPKYSVQIAKAIAQIIVTIVKLIPQIIKTVVAGVAKILKSIISSIVKKKKNFQKTGKDVLTALWKGIKSKFNDVKNGLVKFAKSLPKKIKSGLGSLKRVGKDFIAGLANGILEKFRALKEKVAGLAGALPKVVKKVLGIASPSKVMYELGGYFTEGFSNAITDGMKDLHTKAAKYAQTGILGANTGIRNAQPALVKTIKTGSGTSGGNTSNSTYNQTINFHENVNSPIETARKIKQLTKYQMGATNV